MPPVADIAELRCPMCGANRDAQANACNACGESFETKPVSAALDGIGKKVDKFLLILGFAVAVELLILGAIIVFTNELFEFSPPPRLTPPSIKVSVVPGR